MLGCELYLVDSVAATRASKKRRFMHQVVYAMDGVGLKNLDGLISRASTTDAYHKPLVDWETLAMYSEGLIATSSCISGAIPQALVAGDMARAEDLVKWYLSTFGDRFYLEVHDHGIPDERLVREGTRVLADRFGVPVVAANDCHYPRAEDAVVQKATVCITMREQIATGGQYAHERLHMATPDEMAALFARTSPRAWTTRTAWPSG